MDKILILGGSGFLGSAVINELIAANQFEVYSTYHKRKPPLSEDRSFMLNVEDENNIDTILEELRPKTILSALRGDFNKQLRLHQRTAEYLRENGGKLYFFSTANVFDNDLSRPHYEDDAPNPKSEYGQYKKACERLILDILGDNACILRLPQVWGKNSPRMKELLSSLEKGMNILVYPKLYYNTITADMIAKQLCYIMNKNLSGIFHLTSDEVISYKDFHNQLIVALGFKNAALKENYQEEGYFALLSKRNNEFPKELIATNKAIIDYLAKQHP